MSRGKWLYKLLRGHTNVFELVLYSKPQLHSWKKGWERIPARSCNTWNPEAKAPLVTEILMRLFWLKSQRGHLDAGRVKHQSQDGSQVRLIDLAKYSVLFTGGVMSSAVAQLWFLLRQLRGCLAQRASQLPALNRCQHMEDHMATSDAPNLAKTLAGVPVASLIITGRSGLCFLITGYFETTNCL